MGFLKRLFSGYVKIKTYIYGIHEYHGDIKIDLLIPKNRFQKVFTGDLNLETLKRKEVQIFIPKVETVNLAEEEKRKEERLKRQKEKFANKQLKKMKKKVA